jgi:regulator of protease activity HflC (stomatin/prohibitin superfamily)
LPWCWWWPSTGFVVVQPNQAKVAVFLGHYLGTVRRSGFHWVNPLTTRRTLSLRIRNLDTDVLKVNDANGNPIEISAVITWQVQDAAQAVFDVEDYKGFVDIQAETAVRKAAMVSNLMVVLCGERDTQPVVNTGTLYQ